MIDDETNDTIHLHKITSHLPVVGVLIEGSPESYVREGVGKKNSVGLRKIYLYLKWE